jgi:hypothetical protein
MADLKFTALKSHVKVNSPNSGVGASKGTSGLQNSQQRNDSNEGWNHKVADLQNELDVTRVEMQTEIDAQKQLSLILITEIQKYKT